MKTTAEWDFMRWSALEMTSDWKDRAVNCIETLGGELVTMLGGE